LITLYQPREFARVELVFGLLSLNLNGSNRISSSLV
jgi:hypothetical protein